MKPRRFAPRVVGIILSFSLALPSPAWALRAQGVDAEPTRQDVAAGLEGSVATESREPRLFELRRDGANLLVHVGDGRWVENPKPEGLSYFTRILLKGLRQPGVLQPEMEVLELGVGKAPIAAGIAGRVRHVDGTEIAPSDLLKARENLRRNEIANVELFEGDLFEPVRGRRYDLIYGNLPVQPMTLAMAASLPLHVRRSNDGGLDGREIFDRVLREAPNFLKEGGALVMTHPAFLSFEKTERLARELGLRTEVVYEEFVPLSEPSGLGLMNPFLEFRDYIEDAHGIRYSRRRGKLGFPIQVLRFTRPPAAGLEGIQTLEDLFQVFPRLLVGRPGDTPDEPFRDESWLRRYYQNFFDNTDLRKSGFTIRDAANLLWGIEKVEATAYRLLPNFPRPFFHLIEFRNEPAGEYFARTIWSRKGPPLVGLTINVNPKDPLTGTPDGWRKLLWPVVAHEVGERISGEYQPFQAIRFSQDDATPNILRAAYALNGYESHQYLRTPALPRQHFDQEGVDRMWVDEALPISELVADAISFEIIAAQPDLIEDAVKGLAAIFGRSIQSNDQVLRQIENEQWPPDAQVNPALIRLILNHLVRIQAVTEHMDATFLASMKEQQDEAHALTERLLTFLEADSKRAGGDFWRSATQTILEDYKLILRETKLIQAGLEQFQARMPGWLRAVVAPEQLVESVYRVHDVQNLYRGVAVLMDRPLLAREDADPEIVASRLVRLKRDLRSVAAWSDAIPVRVSVWSQKLEDAYRAQGFRVVRITRDEADQMRDPIPPELLLLAVARAVASGEELFAVNVTADYLRLRGVTYHEIRDTLADLFA